MLLVVQSLWFAGAFGYNALPFDEHYHFKITQAYADKDEISPIIFDQPRSLDYLRDLENEASFLYHYLLSFPLRLIDNFSDSQTVQVISLRLLNIALFSTGMYLFYRLFDVLSVRRLYSNIAMLFFIAIPIVPNLAATINYDNALFLLAAGYFLATILYLKGDAWRWRSLATVFIMGIFASLVKFTFLPLFAVGTIFVIVHAYQNKSPKPFKRLKRTFIDVPIATNAALVLLLLIGSGLFSATYIKNIVVYGNIQPSCYETLGLERCKANPIVRRDIMVNETKDERKPVAIADYSIRWMSDMLGNMSMVKSKTGAQSLPIIYNLIFFGAMLSMVVLIYKWGSLKKDRQFYFLLCMVLVVCLSVFIKTMSGYYRYFIPLAIQPRYLFFVLPIILVYATIAFRLAFGHRKNIAVVAVVLICILLTQGGGFTSYIVRSNEAWFWNNQTIRSVNGDLQSIVQKVVIENAKYLDTN